MKRWIAVILIIALIAGIGGMVSADRKVMKPDPKNPEPVDYKLVKTKEGSTAISSDLTSKSKGDYQATVMYYTGTELNKRAYPYTIVENANYSVKIISYAWSSSRNAYGYNIACTKDGADLYIDNPVWIHNPPYEVITSKSVDDKKMEEKITVKEDPAGAIDQFFMEYCQTRPVMKKSEKVSDEI